MSDRMTIRQVEGFHDKRYGRKTKRLLNLRAIRHKFFGKTFTFRFGIGPNGKIGGCTSRRLKQPMLMVDARLRGRQYWDTLIHESIHACFDDRMPENVVKRLATDLTGIIYKVHAAVNPTRKRGNRGESK